MGNILQNGRCDIQTFLPFTDFHWSARCLDNETLDQQRVDTYQIMRALLRGQGDVNDPAALMWHGHERALLAYQQAICNEWSTVRGNKDATWDKTRVLFLEHIPNPMTKPLVLPRWVGNVDFHISHQSNLLRKDEDHYRPWFPGIRNDHIYIWPVL